MKELTRTLVALLVLITAAVCAAADKAKPAAESKKAAKETVKKKAPEPAAEPAKVEPAKAEVAPVPGKSESPAVTLRRLHTEQRTLNREIYAKERSLSQENPDVQTKLAAIDVQVQKLRTQIAELRASRSEVFKAVDADLARLYEDRTKITAELETLRKTTRAAKNVRPRGPRTTKRPSGRPPRPQVKPEKAAPAPKKAAPAPEKAVPAPAE